jgi:hypothetical protein
LLVAGLVAFVVLLVAVPENLYGSGPAEAATAASITALTRRIRDVFMVIVLVGVH